jgi:hypothetical protein
MVPTAYRYQARTIGQDRVELLDVQTSVRFYWPVLHFDAALL